MIKIKTSGSFKHTEGFFKFISKWKLDQELRQLAELGVQALREATPVDTGKTADSWGYEIKSTNKSISITWTNNNINDGAVIALLLEYGHGTGTGGYVAGKEYINGALAPVFNEISNKIWDEVTFN